MKLHEFTSVTDANDQKKITQVRFVLADHADQDKREEWIAVQISIDVPTVRNGALLRSKALSQARDIIDQLAKDFERLGNER